MQSMSVQWGSVNTSTTISLTLLTRCLGKMQLVSQLIVGRHHYIMAFVALGHIK